jgi:hypothetical protein
MINFGSSKFAKINYACVKLAFQVGQTRYELANNPVTEFCKLEAIDAK